MKAARDFVREVAAQLAPGTDLDTVALLTSELVANAVVHTESASVRVAIEPTADALIVGVSDDGAATRPVLITDPSCLPGGRGLLLVDRLARSWGVTAQAGQSNLTWFQVPRPVA